MSAHVQDSFDARLQHLQQDSEDNSPTDADALDIPDEDEEAYEAEIESAQLAVPQTREEKRVSPTPRPILVPLTTRI